MSKRNLIVFNSHIQLFLLSVYSEEILDKFEIIQPISIDSIKDYDENDIIIFTLPESELLKSNINTKSKKVFIDMEGESSPHFFYKDSFENNNFIYGWLEDKNNYFISQRYNDIKHERAITGLRYLSLCYYFSQFRFYQKSKIENISIKNIKYDFITFLGKDFTKNSKRFKILNFILSGDLSSCKYDHNDFKNTKKLLKHKYYNDPYDFSWNLLQSFQGKINLIFETIDLDTLKKPNFVSNEFFFTEKSLRVLLSHVPSILILDKELILYLKSINFKFPYDGFENYEDVKKYVDDIKNMGIDNWLEKNIENFKHNSNEIWKVMYTKETFIKNIFL